jgi:hypothetical protein
MPYFKRKQIIKPDVFKTSKTLREINTFEREDGTPLHYTLINIKNWCPLPSSFLYLMICCMARLGLICKDLSSICTKGKPFNSKVTS